MDATRCLPLTRLTLDVSYLRHGGLHGIRRRNIRKTKAEAHVHLTAFIDEHKRCGDLDGGLDSGYVWLQCSCGGLIMQPENPLHPAAKSR